MNSTLKYLQLQRWGFFPTWGKVPGGLPKQLMAFIPLGYIAKLFELPANKELLVKLMLDNWNLYPQARKSERFPLLMGNEIRYIPICNLNQRIDDQIQFWQKKRNLDPDEAILKIMVPAVWVRHLVEFYLPKIKQYCNDLWQNGYIVYSFNKDTSSSKHVADTLTLLITTHAPGLQTRWLPNNSRVLVKETRSNSGVMLITLRGSFILVAEERPNGYSVAWNGPEQIWFKPIRRAA